MTHNERLTEAWMRWEPEKRDRAVFPRLVYERRLRCALIRPMGKTAQELGRGPQ